MDYKKLSKKERVEFAFKLRAAIRRIKRAGLADELNTCLRGQKWKLAANAEGVTDYMGDAPVPDPGLERVWGEKK